MQRLAVILVVLTIAGGALASAQRAPDAWGLARDVGPLPAAFAPVAEHALALDGAGLDGIEGLIDAHADALRAMGLDVPARPTPLAPARALLQGAEGLAGLAPADQARAALALQPRPDALAALPPVPTFSLPSVALAELATLAGAPLSLEDRLALARADALPPDAAADIATLAALSIFEMHVAALALASPEVDVGLLANARDVVAAGALDASERLAAHGALAFSLEVCQAFSIDLDGSLDVHACDVVLSVDLVGDDLYTNNAGATFWSDLVNDRPAGLLVDTSGDDRYLNASTLGSVAAIGGAVLGVSVFVDREGDDTYDARNTGSMYATGGATFGAAAMIDLAGSDSYASRGHGLTVGQGGAINGVGALYDAEGDDTYATHLTSAQDGTGSGAMNGGVYLGSGLLVDAAGNDSYDAEYALAPGHSPLDIAQRISDFVDITHTSFGIRANGGGSNGVGALVDLAGNDRYEARSARGGALNGAGEWGVGILLDREGDDVYDASLAESGASNGGAATGLGILLDLDGTNAFRASGPAIGASNGAASGFTSGARGQDHMCEGIPRLDKPAIIGGGRNDCGPARPCGSLGGFLELATAPDDPLYPTLSQALPCPNEVQQTTYAYFPAIGILLAGDGADTYESDGVTQGAADLAGIGILVDLGGSNTYIAGPDPQSDGLAQGAGRDLGTGLLLDLGIEDLFELRAGVAGQGAGVLGVGILAHIDASATATYRASVDAHPLFLDGNGVGVRVDLGVSVLEEVIVLGCDSEEETAFNSTDTAATGSVVIVACWPDEDEAHELRNPVTRGPVSDVPKPICTFHSVGGVACASINESGLLTDRQEQWIAQGYMTSEITGGVLYYHDGAAASTYVTFRMTTYDDTCEFYCMLVRVTA